MSERALTDEEQARLDSLRADLRALSQDADSSVPVPGISDSFLERLVRQGSPYATLPRKFLDRCGYQLPAPEDLSDPDLPSELWKVIWVMGLLRMFLERTDHLSDRELYTYLYEEALQEPTAFMPGEDNPPFYTIDPLGSGSADDLRLFIAYYGDRLEPEEKQDLAAGLPEGPIEPLSRPYDRDRFLP